MRAISELRLWRREWRLWENSAGIFLHEIRSQWSAERFMSTPRNREIWFWPWRKFKAGRTGRCRRHKRRFRTLCGPVESKAREIIQRLKQHGITSFRLLFRGNRSRSEVVATFLAVLELCRARILHLAGSETDCTVQQERELPENLTL